MARAFNEQLMNPDMNSLSFEERFGLLVDHEWETRKNNHLKRLIKKAAFAETGACVEDIEYHADRNLDKAQITRFSSCNYISEHHNILLLGATGSGKTYILYITLYRHLVLPSFVLISSRSSIVSRHAAAQLYCA